jgi:hypothetical protein
MTEFVNVGWEDVANRWEKAALRYEQQMRDAVRENVKLEDELARVRQAVKTVYHKGNVAWTKDRPDLTEAYNISGELIEEAMKREDK